MPEPLANRILLVEDDYINAMALQQQLERAKFACIHADGDRAFDKQVAHQEFQLVLMDINLGSHSADGVELMRRLRENPRTRHLPVFAVTGHSRYGDPDFLVKQGFDRYIAKPVDFSALLQLIRETLASPPAAEVRT